MHNKVENKYCVVSEKKNKKKKSTQIKRNCVVE